MNVDSAEIDLIPATASREISFSRDVSSLVRFTPVLLACVTFGVAAWAFRPYPVGIFHDDGVYLILARAIASGAGYRYLHIPGAPLATHYPPGYPLFLALLLRLTPEFPSNTPFLLLANAALLGAAAWGVDRFARCQLAWPRPAAALLALASTLSLPLLLLGGTVMSEVFFLALLFPFLCVAERAVRAELTPGRALLLGAGAGALSLVRIFALPIVAMLVLLFAMRRRWAAAACCLAGACVALVPWQLWMSAHQAALPPEVRGSYGSYFGWYADGIRTVGVHLVTHTIRVNAREIVALLADRAAPWSNAAASTAGVTVAVVLAALGILRLAHRAPVFVGFAIAYLAITLAFPWSPWRYFWGAWPIVLLLVGAGAHALWCCRPCTRYAACRAALVVVIAFLGVGAARAEGTAYVARAWAQPARRATAQIAPLVRWVSRNTQPGDVVLADDEPLVFLYTGRRAVAPLPVTSAEYVAPRSAERDRASVRALLREYRVRYVVTVVPWTYGILHTLADSGAAPALRERERFPNGGAFEVRAP